MSADKPGHSNPFAAITPVRNPFTPNTSDTEDNASSTSAIVLRPSALTPKTLNMGQGLESDKLLSNYEKPFILKPARLHNPLAANSNFSPIVKDKGHKSSPDNPFCRTEANGDADTEVPSLVSVNHAFNVEDKSSNDCLPAPNNNSEEAVVRNFVFGRNLGERVVNARTSCESTSDNEDSSAKLFTQTTLGGSTADEAASISSTSVNDEAAITSPEKSLEESAKEYQAKYTLKEYEQVTCQTGEESESNVLHANCKLHLFNNESRSWSEKGRGLLRVNDMLSFDGGQSFQSRMVMRTHGSFKVILNTKIWCEMTMEKASEKNLRFTAQDEDGSIKVYLLSTGPKDADNIYQAVDYRIHQIRTQQAGETVAEHAAIDSEAKMAEKRPADEESLVETLEVPVKKHRVEESRHVQQTGPVCEESNDSSTVEPTSEASNSTHSSPTIKSTSSE